MKRKDESVSLVGLQPPMHKAMKEVDYIWSRHGQEAVITAGTEAFDDDNRLIHSAGSLHPLGYALDFRTRYFEREVKLRVYHQLKTALLNTGFQTAFHKSHIHIEYDPDKDRLL